MKKTGEDNIDGTGEVDIPHNPFSKPRESMSDFMAKKNIGEILTTQYDITLNGFEIGSGSLRNYKPDALKTTFEIMGYSDRKIEGMFRHMMKQ